MLNQPTVEAAYYDWAASVERITQARSFPDPQFTFQMDIQNVVTSIMPGIMGTIPWPDKLRVAAQIASAESQAKYFAFRSAVLAERLRGQARLLPTLLPGGENPGQPGNLGLLTDLEKLARAQNEVAKVTLQDVLRAQIEQDRLRTEIANLEDSRNALIAQFKAALGMKAEEPAPPMPHAVRVHFPGPDFGPVIRDRPRAKSTPQVDGGRGPRRRGLDHPGTKARLPDFSLGFMADAKTDPTLYRLPGKSRHRLAAASGATRSPHKSPRPKPTSARLEARLSVGTNRAGSGLCGKDLPVSGGDAESGAAE